MQNNSSQPWLPDRAKSFLDSLYKFIALSPALIVLYLAASGYVVRTSLEDQQTVRSFIEWFGTAYSLFLALVLVNVWGQFETVDREFDRELDAITTLYETTNFTQNSVKPNKATSNLFSSINIHIKEYVEHVLKNYQLEHRVALQYRLGDMILEKIGKDVSLLANSQKIIEPLISEMFKSLSEAIDVRGDRISHSKERTRDTVLLVAFISSVVWLLSFFGLVITDLIISLVLIGGVSFVILMVLIIIIDLDNPFDGTWKVNLDNWYDFRDRIDPFPHIIFVSCINHNWTDRVRHRLGSSICKLTALLNSGWFHIPWTGFIKRVQARHSPSNNERDIRWDKVYANEFEAHGYREFIKNPTLPFVILKLGDEMSVLLGSEDLTACPDLHRFEEVLHQKMSERFSWYQVSM